jgi:1-phosphofructokinase
VTRIVLVAASPAIDRVAVVADASQRGTVRALRAGELPGGKAIHAGRTAAALGADVALVLAVAGAAGRRLVSVLRGEGLTTVPVRLAGGETRRTFTLVDAAHGDVLEVLEPPAPLTAREADRLAAGAARLAGAGTIVAFGGSLPSGAPDDLVARIVRAAGRAGAFTSVDTSGAALAQAIAEAPDLVKPNVPEAEQVLGRPLDSPAEAADALRARGARAVLLTAGADGAVVADGTGVVELRPPPGLARVNAVGCGDALHGATLALLARGRPLAEAARYGVAAAAEKLGRDLPAAADRAAIERLADQVTVLSGTRGTRPGRASPAR